jgi:hypothetical protein
MVLQLAREEPEAGPWRVESLAAVIEALTLRVPVRFATGGPVVLAVDGRSSSGKTTLAARMRGTVAGSVVVHTDDIAWRHSRLGWTDLLVDGVLMPVRQGRGRRCVSVSGSNCSICTPVANTAMADPT